MSLNSERRGSFARGNDGSPTNNPTLKLSVVLFIGFSVCANGATGIFREVPLPAASAGSSEIIRGPDGAFWFTEFSRNKVGRIRPATGEITEFDIPTPNSGPLGITTGYPSVWFTEFNANQIGRIAPDGTVTEFPIPT